MFEIRTNYPSKRLDDVLYYFHSSENLTGLKYKALSLSSYPICLLRLNVTACCIPNSRPRRWVIFIQIRKGSWDSCLPQMLWQKLSVFYSSSQTPLPFCCPYGRGGFRLWKSVLLTCNGSLEAWKTYITL